MDLEQEAKEYADNEVPFDTTESGEKLYTKFDVEYAYIQGAKKSETKLEETKEIIKEFLNANDFSDVLKAQHKAIKFMEK